jgi:hypothetical protein
MAPGSSTLATLAGMDDDVRALLELHEAERTAHLEGDARLIGSLFGDVIHEVSGGEVRSLTAADLERRFADSWARLRYLEWSDIEPPIVGVSGDTGWMLVRVHARRVSMDGAPLPDFDAAWIGIYERKGGAWKLRAISSSLVERA